MTRGDALEDLLAHLEQTVRRATAEVERLRQENRELAGRLEELEAQAGPASDWQEERGRIKGRVERIAEHLEKLLDS